MSRSLRRIPPVATAALWLLALLVAVTGCGPAADCTAAGRDPASVELGTGSVVFKALAEGGNLELIQGEQGGIHTWASARFTGVYPGVWDDPLSTYNPVLQFSIESTEGPLAIYLPQRRPLKVRSDDTIEIVGEAVQMLATSLDQAAWQTAQFTIQLEDSCGTSVIDSLSVLLVPSCSD